MLNVSDDLEGEFGLTSHHVLDSATIPAADPSTYIYAIESNNRGFKLLQKFGWKGNGLGKAEQGIKAPVIAQQAEATLGIGKAFEYDKVVSEVTRDRKKMDVEIIQTSEIIQKKREATDRQESIEIDLIRMTQEFYCEICDKRYKNVSEMSNHLSSYDHHHKKRFKEMKDVAKKRKRGFAIGESDEARKDEIRRREEKREARDMEIRINKAREASSSSNPLGPLPGSTGSTVESLPPPAPLPPMQPRFSNVLTNTNSTMPHLPSIPTFLPPPPPLPPRNMSLLAANLPVITAYLVKTTCSVGDNKYSSALPDKMKDISATGVIDGSTFTGSNNDSYGSSSSQTHSVASDLNIASSCIGDATVSSEQIAAPVKPLVMKFNFSKKKK